MAVFRCRRKASVKAALQVAKFPRPLVVGQCRERVAVVDANDAGGDGLDVGSMGLGREADNRSGDDEETDHPPS